MMMIERTEVISKENMANARQYSVIPTIGNTMQRFKASDYELFTATCRLNKALSDDGKLLEY